MYDVLTHIMNSRSHDHEVVISGESPGLVEQVHRVVGAAILKVLDRFCPREKPNNPVFRLLNCLAINHKGAMNDVKYLAK